MSELEIALINIIKSNIENVSSTEQINYESCLKDMGINSLGFIKIVIVIEDEFDIEFDDELLDVSKMETFKDLVSFVESKL